MSTCVVCGARYPTQILRAFPKDESRRKSWFNACNLKYRPSGNWRLCLNHFSETQLETKRADGRLLLKHNAIPDNFPKKNKDSKRLKEYQQNIPSTDSDLRPFVDHVYELHFDKKDIIDTYELNSENKDQFKLRKISRWFQKSPKEQTRKSKKRHKSRRRHLSVSSAKKRKNVEYSPENIGNGNSLNHQIENVEIENSLVEIRVVNTVDNAVMVEEIHEIENIDDEDPVMNIKVTNTVKNAFMLQENYDIENIEIENPVLDIRVTNTLDNAIMIKENNLQDEWTVHKIPGCSVAYLKWGPEHEIEKKIIVLPDFKTKIFLGNEQIEVQGFQSVSSKSEISRLIDTVNRM